MKIKDDTFNPIKAGGGRDEQPLRPNQALQNMGLREIPTYVYSYTLIGLIAQK